MKPDLCVTIGLCALLAIPACGSSPSRTMTGVRDSAGVEIVELALSRAARSKVGSQPLLDLSAREDSAGEFFHVVDGALLSDGAIAVLNAGSFQVRIFGSDALLESQFGREGDGPGEFRMPFQILEIPQQGILVHDIGRSTVSMFDRAGSLLAMAQLPRLSVWSLVDGWLQADRLLLSYWTVRPTPGAFQQQITQYLSYSWITGVTDSMARVSSGTIGFIGGLEPWGVVGGALFEAAAHAITAGGLAAIGDGAIPELRLLDGSGKLRRILRWQLDPQPVRDEDLRAFRQARLGEIPDLESRKMMEKQLDATPVADNFPAFSDLKSDRDGRVWIQGYVRPQARTQLWYVVDLASNVITEVRMPVGMQLLDARSRTVLVMERDDLEVEHVRLYPVDPI